ncbi:MAG: DUF6323 family protein [Coprobacillus sp.]
MFDISLVLNEKKKEKIESILVCNHVSNQYGLVLNESEVLQIIETQESSLKELERVEFGGDIIEQIIYAFYDSQFISKYEYGDSISRLVEIFYCYREELDERLSDEQIIEYMKRAFNGPCQGSYDSLEDGLLWSITNALDDNKDIYMDDEYGYF